MASLKVTWMLCLVLLLFQPPSNQIVIKDPAVEEFLKNLIVEFNANPGSNRWDNVIAPPKLGSSLWPKVFIWCPAKHFNLEILCPVHQIPIKTGFFTDELKRKSHRNPRMVYDLRGNVLLVQRCYFCPQGKHKYLSAGVDILNVLPKLYGDACFPVMMSHRSACTKRLVDLIETQVLQGISFLQICNGIATLNYHEYRERMERFSLLEMSNSNITEKNQIDGFYSDEMFSFPSNDKIMDIFLSDQKTKQIEYKNNMDGIARSSKWISCDHTFKVSKYIGASRGYDQKFVKQFENLYIILNENGQVVGWRLTRSTAFKEIRDLLMNFKELLQNDLEMVIVDDCCRVRELYKSIFPDVTVKLDLFHAVQRTVKTFPKGTEASRQISKDFGLVFRKDGDCGEDRLQSTPEPDVIERNLNTFVSRWSQILNHDTQSKTIQEIENIKAHVGKGCLSNIPVGYGTECNERLHHMINDSLLCGSSTISPEIAIAVLTLIFYGVNCRKTGKQHQKNSRIVPFVPLLKGCQLSGEEMLEELPAFIKPCEIDLVLDNIWLGSGENNIEIPSDEKPSILIVENVDDLLNDATASLVCESMIQLSKTFDKVDEQCNDRTFVVNDIPIMQLAGVRNVLVSDVYVGEKSSSHHDQLLNRNLQSFDLCIDAVEGDGDCAFTSIIRQLRKLDLFKEGKLQDHFRDLGLDRSIEHDVYRLRELFVDAVQSNENYQMLLGINSSELNDETERFRESGTFCCEMGDIIMKVCSDILQVPFIVITSIPGCPYMPFIPEQQVTTEMMYISFNAFGPGHYDSTSCLVNSDERQIKDDVTCACGRNRKGENISSCLSPHTTSRGRKCPCLHQGKPCGRSCRCKGCKNGKKETINDINKKCDAKKKSSCRCGETGTKIGIPCVDSPKRKSTCPCFNNNEPCGENCFCQNCQNSFGSNINRNDVSVSPVTKRKRSNPSPYKRVRSVNYLLERKCLPNTSIWSKSESCLLFATLNIMSSSLFTFSLENLTKLYNYIVESDPCKVRKLPVRVKELSQIRGKMALAEEKQKIFISKLESRKGS